MSKIARKKFRFATDGFRRVTVYAPDLEKAKERAIETLDKRIEKTGTEPPINWGLRLIEGDVA